MNVTIYAIKDPRSKEPVYVGRTRRPLNMRLYAHYQDDTNPAKKQWLQSLIDSGIEPIIESLQEVNPDKAPEAEAYWINQLRADGFSLFNQSTGGRREGAGRKPLPEKKIPLTVYKEQSTVDRVGGRDQARQLMSEALDKAAKKKNKSANGS